MSTSTTTPVTGVDFVNVPTTDLDRAAQFYGEVLGLERLASTSAATRRRWAPSSRPAR